jgi:hypothetical protein
MPAILHLQQLAVISECAEIPQCRPSDQLGHEIENIFASISPFQIAKYRKFQCGNKVQAEKILSPYGSPLERYLKLVNRIKKYHCPSSFLIALERLPRTQEKGKQLAYLPSGVLAESHARCLLTRR